MKKHIQPQLSFAKRNNVIIEFGDPLDEKAGKNIVIPKDGSFVKHQEIEMNDLRKSYLKRYKETKLTEDDYLFLCEELRIDLDTVKEYLK